MTLNLNKISPKLTQNNKLKIIIPTLMLASGVAATTLANKNDTLSAETNIEYMDKNPTSQAMQAGFLGLFGLGLGSTKRKQAKEWENIRKSISTLYDLHEEPNKKIEFIIKKLETESKDHELSALAKEFIIYIKNYVVPYRTYEHVGWRGPDTYLFINKVQIVTKMALYPELATEEEKQNIENTIESCKKYISGERIFKKGKNSI